MTPQDQGNSNPLASSHFISSADQQVAVILKESHQEGQNFNGGYYRLGNDFSNFMVSNWVKQIPSEVKSQLLKK